MCCTLLAVVFFFSIFCFLFFALLFFFLMIRRPPRSTLDRSSAASDVYKRQLLLAFVINYTGKELEILWLHLGLLLFLLGLTSFSEQMSRWDLSKTDYSESTSMDTLLVIVVMTITLTAFSSFASSVSVKDIIEKLRERNVETSAGTQGESLGLEPVPGNANITGIGSGLPRSHLITGGPELSQQLVMTISTGELVPMSEVVNVPVAHH